MAAAILAMLAGGTLEQVLPGFGVARRRADGRMLGLERIEAKRAL